ncbi:MAG TPA: glycoside hydrolase family 130 protein [Candidatus Limnocylindria bacterium]|nr:glycoside hydrolase family 130 protein [Candidatus Limnocylindria bacterium]
MAEKIMTKLNPPAAHAKRIGPILVPDRSRVLMRPFRPTTEEIARRIVSQVMALPEAEVARLIGSVLAEFGDRHHAVEKYFHNRFAKVRPLIFGLKKPSLKRQALIGAYFTHEYSPESAALFNPSIVPHPDQSGLPRGALRFILSLRATGEGHISSITFRVGVLSARHRITLTPPVEFATEPERVPNPAYDKPLFARKLQELGLQNKFCLSVLDQLHDSFTMNELLGVLPAERKHAEAPDAAAERAARGIRLLAESNYEVRFAEGQPVSQRVIFPSSPSQSNGIEDARFVRFQDEDGAFLYYATYTAYDGKIILPQLLETEDFLHFKFITLNGPGVRNKGMALFPRKIDGRYAMISRQDDENILIMFSDNIHFWADPKILLSPAQPWELIKMGNCGSPIETEAGWLVLSHGVGAMRKYCIGAFLLDLKDPTRVIGRLRDPLLAPTEAEREGYVPNVVYTCGALLHGGEVVIPYAMSDSATSFATVSLDKLLRAMQ